MAELIVVYWRDIPAQVIVKAGGKTAKRELPERFEQAIDRAAMRAGRRRHRRLSGGVAARGPRALRRRPGGRGRRRGGRASRPNTARSALRELVTTKAAAGETAADVRRPPLVGPPCARFWRARSTGRLRVRLLHRWRRPVVCSGSAFERLEAPAARPVERNVKGLLFDCRMCGQCMLCSTGMSCPMNCPKQCATAPAAACGQRPLRGQAGDALRLGPGLGGLAPDGAGRRHPGVQPPVDQPPRGLSSWLRRACARRPPAARSQRPRRSLERRTAPSVDEPADPLPLDPCRAIPRAAASSACCARGEFAVTAELNPPDSPTRDDVYDRAAMLRGLGRRASTPSTPRAPTATCPSVGICALLTRIGYAPIMQISCRDKNRIAIQGDVLGAAAMGVANILCLTGDGVQCGDQPERQAGLRPRLHRRCCETDPHHARRAAGSCPAASSRRRRSVFLGAADNPFAPPYDFRPLRLAKKIAAGAQFVPDPVLLRRADARSAS